MSSDLEPVAVRLRELADERADGELHAIADALMRATTKAPAESESSGSQKTMPLEDHGVRSTIWQAVQEVGPLDALALAQQIASTDANRYVYLSELGRGGMGEVLEVLDNDFNRRVAMKRIPLDGATAGDVELFLHEAQVTGQLEHPGAVPAYDIGIWKVDGARFLFYTMKLVRGRALNLVFRQERRGSDRKASRRRLLRVLQQVCQTVHYAHTQGVLHRDLKPDNVMLGPFGEVYVVDWGIASVRLDGVQDIQTRMTSSGRGMGTSGVVGTPGYMAPELVFGVPPSEASDVWSLGAILYKLLVGVAPYSAKDWASMAKAVKQPWPRPVDLGVDVNEALERLCMAALAHAPGERTQTALELHDAIESFLAGAALRDRSRAEALTHADQGLERSGMYLITRLDALALQAEVDERRRALSAHTSQGDKDHLEDLESRAAQARADSLLAFADAEHAFQAALKHEPGLSKAREGLADLFFERLRIAEQAAAPDEALYFRRLVETYHDGKYDRELSGGGSLWIASQPAMRVELYRYELQSRRIIPTAWPAESPDLGPTPAFRAGVPPGSYLIVANAPGLAEIRMPVWLERNRDLRVELSPLSPSAVPDGFVPVPAGPFRCGGDRDAPGALPAATVDLPGFLIGRFPVTCAEYLAFLDDLPEDQARRHAPRFQEGATDSHWICDQGRWSLPDTDVAGTPWAPNLPVVEITWHDAQAWCAWKSGVLGRTVRLPTGLEWEKSARGVDGRAFPWGDNFDPTWCNMSASRGRGPARPGPVGEFEVDCSVYGVRDCAGNIWEWTSDEQSEGSAWFEVRGGAWANAESHSRCARRAAYYGGTTRVLTGFRALVELGTPGPA